MLLMGRQSSFTGTLPLHPRLLGGDEEAGIKKIKINYRDASRPQAGGNITSACLRATYREACHG